MFFLPRGFGITQEGWYYSVAWRLAQGDLLLQDTAGSATTLSFWWLSWVFRIFPQCGFLGLRIIWAIIMLSCMFITANLMRRYFSPLVSLTGAAASLFFVDAVTTMTAVNYNTLPPLLLLFSAWLWLTAHHRNGKTQLSLAAAAGAAAFLATTCKIPLVIVIFLPILSLVYDRCCGIKTDGLWRAAIVFMATYSMGVMCLFLIVGLMGLTSDFLYGLALSGSFYKHGLAPMVHQMIWSSLFILCPVLVVVLTAASFRYRNNLMASLVKLKKGIKLNVAIIIATALLLASLGRFFLHKLKGFYYITELVKYFNTGSFLWTVPWLPILLATGIILADIVFNLFNHVFNPKTGKNVNRVHDRCRLGIMAIFLSFAMILGTHEFPGRPAWLNAWLLISLAVGLSWHWFTDWSKKATRLHFAWFIRVIGIMLLLLFPYYAMLRNCKPWDDKPVSELSVSPKTARLHGILTTRQRADFIDSLVDVVKRNSKPRDRILVLGQIPMLYYLTDRLPSINITWLQNWIGKSYRQHALEKMIQHDRVPKVVVVYYPSTYRRWVTATNRTAIIAGEDINGEKLIGNDDTDCDISQSWNYPSLWRFQAIATGALNTFRLKSSGSGNVKVGIYSDDDGEPCTSLSSTAGTAVTEGWNDISITSTQIVAGNYYWLAVVSNPNIVCCDIAAGNRRYISASYNDWNWDFDLCVAIDPIQKYVMKHYKVVQEIGEARIMLPKATVTY